jgi:O-antigen/teichoic acid export membrane protein
MPHRSAGTRPAGHGNLSRVAARALGWSFLSTAVTKFGLVGFGVLLARLLGPHQYGDVAVAMAALLAVLSFNELGVSLAIVRWRDEPAQIVPTVATISVGTSALLFVAAFFAAPAFSQAMGAPGATPVVRVTSLIIITNGVASVPAAVLQRHFMQDRQMAADQVHGWLGAVVSLALALRGFGAMSVAVGQVSGAAAGGIMLIVLAPLRISFGFDRSVALRLLRFGLPLAGSGLVVFLVGNVDNFIVGHMLGATILGFYVLAWNLASLPVNMFSQPVRSVAPAFFARLQDNPTAMHNGFVSAAGLLGAVTFPVCLVISGCAAPLVKFIYGGHWAGAAQPLAWLAILAALRVFFELAYDYFVVLARSRVVLAVQLGWLAALIPALMAGADLGGIRGVSAAGVVVALGMVVPWYLYELSRASVRLGALARRLWLPIVMAMLAGLAAWGVSKAVQNDFGAIAISGVIGSAVVGLSVYSRRSALAELRHAETIRAGFS